MKIKNLIILIIFSLFFNFTLAQNKYNIFIDGVKLNIKPIIKNNLAYFPVQVVASNLKIRIQYSAASKFIRINDKKADIPFLILDKKFYLPIEEVAKAAGFGVEWDGEEESLKITSPKNKYETLTKKVQIESSETNTTYNPPLEKEETPPEAFIPRSASNGIFLLTVTNVELVNTIKDYYKPKNNYQFVVVYLSQQNISDLVQTYTGKFYLIDNHKNIYNFIEGLSNFWLIILRPGGNNFGYLVFEIPKEAKPSQLILQAINQAALSVSLSL